MGSNMEMPVVLNTVGVTSEVASQIGEKLRAARQARGKNAEDISKELKLNLHFLNIIESGQWNELPCGAPGRAFVRLYARYLAVPLPEFEEFLELQKTVGLSNAQTNLDKLIECARLKQNQSANRFYKFIQSHLSSLAKLSVGKIKVPKIRKKNLILPISCGFLFICTIGTAFLFTKNQSDELDQFENSVVLDNAPIEKAPVENLVVENSPAENATAENKPMVSPIENPQVVLSAETSPMVSASPVENVQAQQEVPKAEQRTSLPAQKMKIDILSPVAIKVDTDERSVFDGIANPGRLTFEFQKNAKLLIQDSSKVKLSYAGWEEEQLSTYTRKRVIELSAQRFSDTH